MTGSICGGLASRTCSTHLTHNRGRKRYESESEDSDPAAADGRNLVRVAAGRGRPTDQGHSDNDRHYSSNFTPIVNEVRRAVLSLPKEDLAKYGSILKTPCVTGPEFGAMGVHLINHEFVDGVVDVNKPEALIYEPQSNGKLRIVGVEYIVPKEAWDAANPAQPGLPSPRPSLLGHLLNFVDSPNRYGIEGGFFEIHVWAFEDNPQGRADRLESRRHLREATPSRACKAVALLGDTPASLRRKRASSLILRSLGCARGEKCVHERRGPAAQRRALRLEQRRDEERVIVELDGAQVAGVIPGRFAQRTRNQRRAEVGIHAVAAQVFLGRFVRSVRRGDARAREQLHRAAAVEDSARQR